MGDRYLHGHHDSVLRAHAQRTAANSADYLLPHLEPGMRVLDVGCGPATITVDLATRVAPGAVVGWQQVYRDTALAGGYHPDAGRMLKSWALAAGFEQIAVTGDVWCYAADDEVEWWSSTWADRAVHSGFAAQAVQRGVIDRSGLQQIREAWLEWGSAPDACFLIPHGQLLARA